MCDLLGYFVGVDKKSKMNSISLKNRLIRFLQNNPVYIASGELQRIVSEKTSYSPSNVSRRLREAENEGKVLVDYRKGHAFYKIK